jgi:hypothetical protein
LNYKCDYVTYVTHPFYCSQEYQGSIIRAIRLLNSKNIYFFSLLAEFLKFIFFFKCLIKYDIFIFSFGKSILYNNWDLYFLKKIGKIIIVNVAHGSELRPAFLDGSFQSQDGKVTPSISKLKALTKKNYEKAKRIERHVEHIIGAPFSSSFYLNKKFINSFVIGIPYVNSYNTCETNSGDKIRILHSPSHLAVKGTLLIRDAIESVKKKGYDVEYIEIVNSPNSKVIEEIKKCTFIVDQIYSDTPLAGFATEAAWFGKPAIVGGYALDYLKNFIPIDLYPPSYTCLPDDIEVAIENFILNKEVREDIGKKAKEFVQEKWHYIAVAEKFQMIFTNQIPNHWYLDPNDIEYKYGVGQSEIKTKDNLIAIIKRFGLKSLFLQEKPKLIELFLNFSKSHK